MIIRIRNNINHFILNALLRCRYQARKNPHIVKCIVAAEIMFVKTGLIYYGRNKINL